ncbi:FtsK/SpoIIIE domain-containing protein [Streptomyces sp. NPDC101116]|uniref:FtsK/SpoIIIE domain-containing protein n=1 Tax=Streptomyces sp. NPDC101116 TaxID=3366107 RepID=UPI0037F1B72F
MTSRKVSASGESSVAVGGDANAPILTNPQFYLTVSDHEIPDPIDWPRVHEMSALRLGVHRTRNTQNGPTIPEYIERDSDAEIANRIDLISTHGGILLITGDSTSGKSRTAYNAIQRLMPNHRIYAPTPGTELFPIPRILHSSPDGPFLLWLDDLEGFLGYRGIDPMLTESLEREKVAIVATMRDELFDTYTSGTRTAGEMREHNAWQAGNRLLRMIDPVRLERLWSPEEIARAERVHDERISEALKYTSDYGISEYLAAGPSLLQAWKRAKRVGGHPRGAALVQTSVDLARSGFTDGVDIEVLKDLHVKYLSNPSLRPEPWDEALSWATSVQYGASSLLVPGAYEQTWRAFDYLPDALSKDKKNTPDIPHFIWEEALALNPEEGIRWLIGMRAYMARETQYAISAWEPLAESGNTRAANNLAEVYLELGNKEAVRHWRQIANLDDFYSGTLEYRGPDYNPDEGTVTMGRAWDREPTKIQLNRPGIGVCHGVIAGAPGVGKSNALRVLLVGALTSHRYILCLLDWSREQKHFEEFREAAQWYEGNDLDRSMALLYAITRLLDFRIEKSGYVNPTLETPAILVAIEEAQNIFNAEPKSVELALRVLREGERAGVSLYLTLPDVTLASFGGSEELRSEFARDSNTAFLMGDEGLQMIREWNSLRPLNWE